ncbi:MAG TPA: YdcF family protein, partial [Anaerolineae bacterium]
VQWRWFVVPMIAPLLFLAVLLFLYQQVDARAKIDGARRTDAIIVLGSAVWQGERASPSLYARTQHAIALYRAGYAPALILCGGLGGNPPSEAEVMRRLAASAGVPADALLLDDQSHSTEENLANAKALMDARGWHSALIVSDPFHLLRAELIARDLGIDAYGSGASDSPTYTAPQLHAWYTAREAVALVWYYTTRVVGEPAWLYGLLKGKI